MLSERPFFLHGLLLLGALLALALLTLTASARDIDGDWTVNVPTTFTDETINVRGNIVVNASLELDNCTLVLVRADDGLFIDVTENGSMMAEGCAIRGDPGRVYFNSSGHLNLTHCVVSHLYDNYPHGGMNLYGGQATISHSTIMDVRSKSIYSETDLVLENVTFRGSQQSFLYLSDGGATSDLSVVVRGCDMDGTDNGVSNKPNGIFVNARDETVNTTVLISDCLIRTCDPGIALLTFGNMTARVEDCVLLNCTDGVYSDQRGPSSIGLDGIRISKGWDQQPCGLRPLLGPDTRYSVRDVTVDGYLFGCWLQMIEGADLAVRLDNVTISDCVYGIKVWKSGHEPGIFSASVYNSSVSAEMDEFQAIAGVQIAIWNTSHTPGSAEVRGSGSWVRGYARIHPLGARWHDGPNITSGLVNLYDESDGLVITVDLVDLVPRYLLGWERTESDGFTIRVLKPRMTIDDRTWEGAGYDPWRRDRRMLELVDDFAPTVNILHPTKSQVLETSSVEVSGTFSEKGSGLMAIEGSLDDGAFLPVSSLGAGSWEISLEGLSEGGHSVSVRGVDMVNRSGNVATVGFFVNSLPPPLEVDPLPCATRDPQLLLTGMTEPDTGVTVNDVPASVRSDGSFHLRVTLDEGANVLSVRARDRWDKVSWVNVTVLLDSTPPSISGLSPANGSWIANAHLTLEGMVDEEALVSLNGEPVDLVDGSFREHLDVEEGEVNVTLRAEDALGNALVLVLLYRVDLTAPVLTITSPGELSLMTTTTPLEVVGDVDDPTVDHVTIDGLIVPLDSGGFRHSMDLEEGNNSIEVSVRDAAGNGHTTMLFVNLDTTGPTFEVAMECVGGELMEADGELFATADELILDIDASEPVFVTLADGSEEGPFEMTHIIVHLEEGENRVYLRVTDLAGNQGRVYESFVVLDTTPPAISVETPLPDTRTTRASVLVSGNVEPGSRLRIDGEEVTVLGDGTFEVEWALDMGRNTITLEAEDPAGHNSTSTLTVTREEEGGVPGPRAAAAVMALLFSASAIAVLRLRRSQAS